LEPSGLAILPDGRVAIVSEGDAAWLYAPTPTAKLGAGGLFDLFPLSVDERDQHAQVRLAREPISWLPRYRVPQVPWDVEDLAPMGPDRVLGVTEYSTVGRRTGYRKDWLARSRRQTERIFVLERAGAGWREVAVPEVDRLRDSLSDWGRAHCDEDMLVEGLAYDPGQERAWIGLSRCGRPVAKVLRYDLGAARRDEAVAMVVEADGVEGGSGPAEGVAGLSHAGGRLWAVTAWDSWGHEVEPRFGGRLHEVTAGRLVPVPGREPFLDRPGALAVLAPPGEGAPFADLDAIVLFDNDAEAGRRTRPNVTVLRARTPAPEAGSWAQLLSAAPVAEPLPVALNGVDFRWYARDHRLAVLAATLARQADGPLGAWTRAIGGLWQIRVGASFGNWAATLGIPGRSFGHDKQSVAFTDYTAANLTWHRYRARLSVAPRDRERENPSVAALLERVAPAYRVTTPLRAPAGPEAGLVLQGFEIDTASRAENGICLAALQLGVDWHDAERSAVDLQATVVGGLCNDFDARGPQYRHGLTSDAEGGVEVVLHYAVVEGGEASAWSAWLADRDPPGPRDAARELAEDAEEAMGDLASRRHLHCARWKAGQWVVDPSPRPGAPPATWLEVAPRGEGAVAMPASLRGFTLALDPSGFGPDAATRELTEVEAFARNNYIHRYLVRAVPDGDGVLVEGGLSHGIHRVGLMRDSARPSAVAVGVDMTSFSAAAGAVLHDSVSARQGEDVNVLPEDGFVRWAAPIAGDREVRCSPAW
jgi:hypothetical protein